MTPQKKLKLAEKLYFDARALCRAGLKANNPDWSDDKLDKKVTEIFQYART